MANTFSNLVANAYKALDVVSRELVGFVNSVTLDADAAAIPVGQTLYSVETETFGSSSTITPAVTPPTISDRNVGSQAITIDKRKYQAFRWSGEETFALDRGARASVVNQGTIAQAIRSLVNEMESDVWAEARVSASRAYGSAGTTPFASDLAAAAEVRRILDDNGADGARSLVINTAAGVKLRTLAQLTKVNESGTTMALRDGELLDLFGLSVKESAAVTTVTPGTGSGYLVNSAALAVGSTTIPCDTGTGTIKAGDVVTFAGDTNKYVVASDLSGGSFTICKPGLRTAVADNAAIAVTSAFTANVAFSQSSIILAARTPFIPDGDSAVNQEIIQDPRSGISFRLAQYPGFHQGQYHIEAAWGVHGIKPAHAALLLG